jgi:hypothetical protein
VPADPLLVLAVRGRRTSKRGRELSRRGEGGVRVQRPGNRAVTSWNSQPLPSGSLNEANER